MDQGRGHGVKVGEGSRFGGSRLWSRFGVKIEGGVMVGGQGLGRGQGLGSQGCGQGRGSRSWGQGQGYDRWSQSRGQCRGQCLGEGVMVRGMRVKVWGVGVRWSVGFIVEGGCR